MSHTATETDPTPFDAEAYRVRYGVREYLRYVSNIESEQKAWTLNIVSKNRKLKSDNEKIGGLEAEVLALKDRISVQGRQLEERDTLQTEANIAKQRLQDLEEATASCKYAVILVDGDGYNFPDNLIRQGLKGGQQAAQHLESQTQNYLKGVRDGTQLKIIVRIFMSLDNLSRVYRGIGVISDTNTMRQFMVGFVQTHGLFDVIDVGEGQERADHKLKENLMLYVKDTHCRHILIGCCHDNGYVPNLDPLKTSDIAPKIALIEHHRPGASYHDLPFNVVKLDGIFRGADPTSRPIKRSRSAGLGPSIPRFQPTAQEYFKVQLNRYGERIDVPLPPVKRTTLRAFNQRQKFQLPASCNIHFIFGPGSCTGHCKFSHDGYMDASEVLALASLARDTACKDGPRCRNGKCFHGHQCIFDPACKTGSDCKFFPTHGIDKRIVLEESGTESFKRPRISYEQLSSRAEYQSTQRPGDYYERRW